MADDAYDLAYGLVATILAGMEGDPIGELSQPVDFELDRLIAAIDEHGMSRLRPALSYLAHLAAGGALSAALSSSTSSSDMLSSLDTRLRHHLG